MSKHYTAAKLAAALTIFAVTAPQSAVAQTDYYNLDSGRPFRTEDALTVERRALEFQLSSFRFSGGARGPASQEFSPEVSWGILPRTQLELSFTLARQDGNGFGASGAEIEVLHALNAETLTIPGIAIGASLHTPFGRFGEGNPMGEVLAIATRTTAVGRIHANAALGIGNAGSGADADASRWRVGVAVDKTLAVRALLIGAEVVLESPQISDIERTLTSMIGMRYQVGPRTAVDVGVGRTFSGPGDGRWVVTFGSTRMLGALWGGR